MFWGYIFWTLRISIGDFGAIDAAYALNSTENIFFWILFVITVTVTCVIFLNFIVAEASASYTKVTETLEAVIEQQKASLIAESQTMMPKFMRTD